MNSVRIDGVSCYGKIEWNSNFEIICDDEDEDCCWVEGNYNSEDGEFKDWQEAVTFFKARFNTVVEIIAV